LVAALPALPRCALLAAAALAAGGTAAAEADAEPPEADKSAFNLFNPTPAGSLREMSLDGPGTTESPYTVDAGHFQIEMTFVDYTSDKQTFDGVKVQLEWLSIAPMILKIGLLNSLDLQLVLEPYVHVSERENGFSEVTRQGFGDMTVRFKYNLWGNDRGRTACAVTPYVKFPTSQDNVGSDIVEGGIIVPFAAELPWDFGLGLTTRFATVQDILGGEDRHLEFGNSIELGIRSSVTWTVTWNSPAT
jgi:hypothetical protein